MSADRLLIDGKLQDPQSIELRDFAAFYEDMSPRVVRAIRNTLGHHYVEGGGADDLAQQVWETILKNWERVGRLSAPHKYIYIVAINHARRALAQRNAELAVGEVTGTYFNHATEPGPETLIEAQLEARSIWQTIKNALAPRQVQVLALAIDGYNDKDIATTLNITTNSVRSHRRHARKQLLHLHLARP
uniref:RNA polymerase sigma factor n=1 Tax=Streptomyces sp. NBC_00998 TaxID=2903712 RepID=UPI002F90C3F8|nr:sigma-70 family RNA polymerase sigma factor [Streptomyces sp. NBC_00998]